MAEIFSYEDLAVEIQKARGKTSRFYRVDLHVHSINSFDYPSTHSKKGFVTKIPEDEVHLKNNPEEFKRRFIQQAKARGLRMVSITDHNESDLAAQLSAMSDDTLVILPGIEISVQTNLFTESEVHIIGIFPEGTKTTEIDKVYPPKWGMPPSGKRGSPVRTSQPINEILETIHQLNGVCIAAHVSSSNGIRTMVHSQNIEWLQKNYLRRYLIERKKKNAISSDELIYLNKIDTELKPLDDEVQNKFLKFLAEYDFDAIQIQEGIHENYYSGAHVESLNLPPFPCILSSDAHTLADMGCHGHASHIKMTTIGIEGLRKALLDPNTRVRYDTNVPTSRPKRILGISFEGGSLSGQVIGFSDNLTTLIGGRGTGKSALIEAIRFVLGYTLKNLPDRLKKDIEDRRDYTLRNSEVKLLYVDEHSGEVVVIKRRLGEERPTCLNIEGTVLNEIQLPNSNKVHAEIYGWNEIEALSDSPKKQLALIDRTIPEIDKLTIEYQSKREELRENNNKLILIAREVNILLPYIQGANELRQELAKLNTTELNEAFLSFDKNEKALSGLRELLKEIDLQKSAFMDKNNQRDIKKNLVDALEKSQEEIEAYTWYSELEFI